MSAEHIRSQPEVIYNRLSEPHTLDFKIAKSGLIRILRPSEPDADLNWRSVSDAILAENPIVVTDVRAPDELLTHVKSTEEEYPWMAKTFSMFPWRQNSKSRWESLARSHVYEDFCGLLGISQQEGNSLSAWLKGEITVEEQSQPIAPPELYVVQPKMAA